MYIVSRLIASASQHKGTSLPHITSFFKSFFDANKVFMALRKTSLDKSSEILSDNFSSALSASESGIFAALLPNS